MEYKRKCANHNLHILIDLGALTTTYSCRSYTNTRIEFTLLSRALRGCYLGQLEVRAPSRTLPNFNLHPQWQSMARSCYKRGMEMTSFHISTPFSRRGIIFYLKCQGALRSPSLPPLTLHINVAALFPSPIERMH